MSIVAKKVAEALTQTLEQEITVKKTLRRLLSKNHKRTNSVAKNST